MVTAGHLKASPQNTNNSFAILWWNSIWKLGGKKLVHEKSSLWGNAEDCQQKSHALQIAPFPYRMSAMSSISFFSSSIIRARIFLLLHIFRARIFLLSNSGQQYFFFHVQGKNICLPYLGQVWSWWLYHSLSSCIFPYYTAYMFVIFLISE